MSIVAQVFYFCRTQLCSLNCKDLDRLEYIYFQLTTSNQKWWAHHHQFLSNMLNNWPGSQSLLQLSPQFKPAQWVLLPHIPMKTVVYLEHRHIPNQVRDRYTYNGKPTNLSLSLRRGCIQSARDLNSLIASKNQDKILSVIQEHREFRRHFSRLSCFCHKERNS